MEISKKQIEKLNNNFLKRGVQYSIYPYDSYTLNGLLVQFFRAIEECIDNVNEYTNVIFALKDWIENEGLQIAVDKKLEEMINDGAFDTIINQKIFSDLNKLLEEINVKQKGIYTFISDYYSDTDNGDYTNAFNKAIQNTPQGGVIYFPFKPNGYLFNSPNNAESVIINKPITIKSTDGAPLILSKNFSTDKDFIVVRPNTEKIGYNFDNIVIATEESVMCCRDLIVYDLSSIGARVSNSYIKDCKLYPVNGYSIKINNPVNTDGYFLNVIENNLIYSGLKGIRIGDSNDVIHNTFAGFNGFDVSLVSGSNTLSFIRNNFTARGGIIFRSGHNIKCDNNNIESGYSDSSYINNSLVNFLGDEVSESWGLLGCSFIGNNVTYRPTAPNVVKGVYVGKCRGLRIEGNYLSNRNLNNMVEISNLATDTFIGRNVYSSADGRIIITDNGVNTCYQNQVYLNDKGHRKNNYIEGDEINRSSLNDNSEYLYRYKYPKATNDAIKDVVVWKKENTFKPKEIKYTQKEGESLKQVSYIGDGYETFESESLRVKDNVGFEWVIKISTDGNISTTRVN